MPALESLRDVWTSWKGHRDSDIDFFKEFLRTRPEVIRPHVIVLYRNGVPDAMLVGRLEQTKLTFRLGYLHLPGVSARMLIFSQGGARGNISHANSAELIRSVNASLRCGEADCAFLHQVDAASPLFQAAVTIPAFATRDHLTLPEPRYAMMLPETVEKLYESFSRAVRQGFRKKKNRLSREFAGRFRTECVTTAAGLERVIPHLEAIAAKTYQRGLGVGFADTPQIREMFHFFAEKRWLRIYILYLNDKPCSFWTGTVHDDLFASDYTGYDPEFRDHSVGGVIAITMIEDLIRQGVKEAEFGAGQAEYKQHFSNCQTMEANIHIFAPTVKGALINAARTLTVSTDRLLKRLLERTKFLPALKKFWRGHLTPAAK